MADRLRIAGPALWLALLILSGAAYGQRAPRSVLSYHGGFGLSALAVEGAEARAGRFPAHGFGVLLDFAPRVNQVFALRAEAGLAFLGPLCFDEEADCPGRRNGDPDPPSFALLSAALAAGLRTPPLRLGHDADGLRLALGLYGGREWLDGRRGVRNCVNCFDEDLRLRGGLFAEAALELDVLPGLGLGASYRAYDRRADLRGRLTVRLIAGG